MDQEIRVLIDSLKNVLTDIPYTINEDDIPKDDTTLICEPCDKKNEEE